MPHTSADEPETDTSPKKRVPFPHWQTSSPWVTLAALAIAVIAVALAIAAWFRPAPSPSFNDQQTAQAKTHVCSTYTAVRKGVVINTHLANPVPNDPIGQFAVAANARLALLGGGGYLRDRLAAEPAAPGDLAKAVDSMADTIEQLGTGYLADAPNDVLDPLRNNLNSQITQINKLCG